MNPRRATLTRAILNEHGEHEEVYSLTLGRARFYLTLIGLFLSIVSGMFISSLTAVRWLGSQHIKSVLMEELKPNGAIDIAIDRAVDKNSKVAVGVFRAEQQRTRSALEHLTTIQIIMYRRMFNEDPPLLRPLSNLGHVSPLKRAIFTDEGVNNGYDINDSED